jgi:hypothetical protein
MIINFPWLNSPILVFTFELNVPLYYQLSQTYLSLDTWGNICEVVSLLTGQSINQYDTKTLFALSTDTSIHIQNIYTSVESVLNDIFISR